MPEEKLCPVVGSYIRSAKAYWRTVEAPIREIYQVQLEGFDELKDNPNALIKDPTTQKLRAFYCLHGLFMLLRGRMKGLDQKLPLTREGIQSLIKFSKQARDSSEVQLYARQIGGAPSSIIKMQAISTDTVIKLTDTIIEAAEYFRPRLVTEGPLASMGKYYAQGLEAIRASSDVFLQHGRELINVSKLNRGDLGS